MSELYLNEPLPPYSMPIKPILVLDSPTIPRVTTPKGSNSPSPKSEARRSNKKVSFAADTVMPRDDNLALSITKHAYTKDLGYTQYTVDFMYHGISWCIHKRYRDFEELNRVLTSGPDTYQLALPVLPKKRWFEKQRWLNRFDESYGIKRKTDLQDYLRVLAKTPIIREKSEAFQAFIDMPQEALDLQQEEMDVYLSNNSNSYGIANAGASEEEGTGTGSGSGTPRHAPQYFTFSHRDSVLETDLNVDFDDEGNAIPRAPRRTHTDSSHLSQGSSNHSEDDEAHTIYSIAEDEGDSSSSSREGSGKETYSPAAAASATDDAAGSRPALAL